MERIGKFIVIAGIAIVAFGIVIWLFGNKLRFLGRLPGDIRYESNNVKVFFPITTMILISILLSIILWIVQKFK